MTPLGRDQLVHPSLVGRRPDGMLEDCRLLGLRRAGASYTSNAPNPPPAGSGPTAAATATSAPSSSAPTGRSAHALPTPLTALLHAHIQEFGVQPDGRLFVGERNDGELPRMTIGRVWRRADIDTDEVTGSNPV